MTRTITLDTETEGLLSDGDEVRSLTESRGWAIVKDKLDNRILDLQNINNIEGTTVDELMFSLKARKLASSLLFEWLKADVYGFVEQQEGNIPRLVPENEDYVGRPER